MFTMIIEVKETNPGQQERGPAAEVLRIVIRDRDLQSLAERGKKHLDLIKEGDS